MRFIFGKSEDDSHEFKPILAEIEGRPVNPLGRTTFWLIVTIIFIACTWLYCGKVDIVVSGRGKVLPFGEIKIIQPLETGVISSINCRPGDYVEKGQVLIEIDPSATQPTLTSYTKMQKNIELEIERRTATLMKTDFNPDTSKYDPTLVQMQLNIFKTEKASLQKFLASKQNQIEGLNSQKQETLSEKNKIELLLEINQKKEKRLKKVKDIIPVEQYEEAISNIINYEKSLEQTTFRLKALDFEKQQLRDEIDYQKQSMKQENLEALAEQQKQLTSYKAEIDKISYLNKKQSLTSPVSGYVIELFTNTIGGVVSPAQNLISILPKDSPLIIEATVMNQDIGFISEGMKVVIKVDAFPFQKYGMIRGTVHQISRDSIIDERLGPVYKVYVNPDEMSLDIDGKETFITTGLTVTVEVTIGKRRIIEFFIYPLIQYLDEGLSVR